ncbi:hypothetical protein [Ideonella sp.]|uniref:hypothetical protein n=1 Tax=Ideonella sp. TaxID=1929293 RepID=UPI0035AF45EC
MRLRTPFIVGGSAAVLLALFFTDPDDGVSTGMLLLALLVGILAIAFAHLGRKALHDYPEADMRRLFGAAGNDPVGAGLALIALAIVFSALLGLFGSAARAADVRSYVPAGAYVHLPTLKAEAKAYWPDHPAPEVLAALVEHESCGSLQAANCWNPRSRLKTPREEGAGFGQITRAYRSSGEVRFDALADLRSRHPIALAGLSWANVYARPDLQLRALVLQSKDNFVALRAVADPFERLAMADAAYNGGLSGVQSERRACGLKGTCDPQRWFGHVETVCLKGRRPLYGGRSACDINRHHVTDVMLVRSPKYRALMA